MDNRMRDSMCQYPPPTYSATKLESKELEQSIPPSASSPIVSPTASPPSKSRIDDIPCKRPTRIQTLFTMLPLTSAFVRGYIYIICRTLITGRTSLGFQCSCSNLLMAAVDTNKMFIFLDIGMCATFIFAMSMPGGLKAGRAAHQIFFSKLCVVGVSHVVMLWLANGAAVLAAWDRWHSCGI